MKDKSQFKNSLTKLRKKTIIYLSNYNYEGALLSCRDLLKITKRLFFHEPGGYFYTYISDSLLFVKCLLRNGKTELANESLEQVWALFEKFFNNKNYKITKMDCKVIEEREEYKLKKILESLDEDPSKPNKNQMSNLTTSERTLLTKTESTKNNLLIIRELKRRSMVLSTIAAMFSAVGNFFFAEKAYVYYIRQVEANYGLNSVEVSNCYFIVGAFYLENNYLKKSIACYRKALDIRVRSLGKDHNSVADCYFNIAILFKMAGRKQRALTWLEYALNIRIQNNGEANKHVANIYELFGLVYEDLSQDKNSVRMFKKCLKIREILYTDPKHFEIYRAAKNLKRALEKIEKFKVENKVKKLEFETNEYGASRLFDGYLRKKAMENIKKTKAEEQKASTFLINPKIIDKIRFENNLISSSRNNTDRVDGTDTQRTFGREDMGDNENFLKRRRGGEDPGHSSERVANNNPFQFKSQMRARDKPRLSDHNQKGRRNAQAGGSIFDFVNNIAGMNMKSFIPQKEKSDGSFSPSDIESELSSDKELQSVMMSEEDFIDKDINEIISMHESIYEVEEDEEFVNELDHEQRALLVKLKDQVFNKSVLDEAYKPVQDVKLSEFYQSLDPRMRKKFRETNPSIFKDDI